ncbi:MAG: hypothetical protein DHS20C05_22260 [Hyphococcus sp.]|nr:MAG: hypothetical protein DHS20C05_22260 [Marinicaulis sp.]
MVEILEPDIKIGHQGARVVIDLTKKSIVSEYIAPRDYEPAYGFRFVNADEVYFAMGDSCITAPSLKPGMLRYAPRKCGALLGKDEHGHKNYYHGDEGLEPGHEGDVALAKKLIPWAAAYYGERLELRVHRIISQDLIVVNTVEACT